MLKYLKSKSSVFYLISSGLLIILVLIGFALANTLLGGIESNFHQNSDLIKYINFTLYLLGLILSLTFILSLTVSIYRIFKPIKQEDGVKKSNSGALTVLIFFIFFSLSSKVTQFFSENRQENITAFEASIKAIQTPFQEKKTETLSIIIEENKNGDNPEILIESLKELKVLQNDYFNDFKSLVREHKPFNTEKNEKFISIVNDYMSFLIPFLDLRIKCEELWIDAECNTLLEIDPDKEEMKYIQNINSLLGTSITIEEAYKKSFGDEVGGKLIDDNIIYNRVLQLNARGLAAFSSGNNEEALKLFSEALKLSDNDLVPKVDISTINHNIALVYADEGRTELAIEAYDKSADLLNKQSYDYFVAKGEVELLRGNKDQYTTLLKKALTLNPSGFSANSSIGTYYIDINDQGHEDLTLALKHNTSALQNAHSEAKYTAKKNLAINHYFLDNYDEATDLFFELIETTPDDYINYYYTGLAYYELGDSESGDVYFKKAVDLNPTILETLNTLGWEND